MEYYSAIKLKEISNNGISSNGMIDLEGIMLNEINQTEKDKYCMVSLICGILTKNSEKKTRFMVARDRVWWKGELGKDGPTSNCKINKYWGYNIQT